MHQLLNSEYYFQKKSKSGDLVGLTVYIQYDNEKYQICQTHEESVFFGKVETPSLQNRLENDIAYAELCREAMKFIESEFK